MRPRDRQGSRRPGGLQPRCRRETVEEVGRGSVPHRPERRLRREVRMRPAQLGVSPGRVSRLARRCDRGGPLRPRRRAWGRHAARHAPPVGRICAPDGPGPVTVAPVSRHYPFVRTGKGRLDRDGGWRPDAGLTLRLKRTIPVRCEHTHGDHARDPQRPCSVARDGAEQRRTWRCHRRLRRAAGNGTIAEPGPRPGHTRLDRGGRCTTFRCATGTREAAAVTWDQVVNWLILPGIAVLIIGVGGVWLSRYIP